MVERSTYMKSLNQFGKFLMLALVLFSFVLPTPVQANDIASIQISATIQENGSVVIRDQRVFYAEEGTEHFISLGNLGDSSLVNFTVYDKDGSPLRPAIHWLDQRRTSGLKPVGGMWGVLFKIAGMIFACEYYTMSAG